MKNVINWQEDSWVKLCRNLLQKDPYNKILSMDGDSLPQDFEQGQLRFNITTQTNACKP